jgi:hypothetical protein
MNGTFRLSPCCLAEMAVGTEVGWLLVYLRREFVGLMSWSMFEFYAKMFGSRCEISRA